MSTMSTGGHGGHGGRRRGAGRPRTGARIGKIERLGRAGYVEAIAGAYVAYVLPRLFEVGLSIIDDVRHPKRIEVFNRLLDIARDALAVRGDGQAALPFDDPFDRLRPALNDAAAADRPAPAPN